MGSRFRIGGSLVLAVLLIGTAFVLKNSGPEKIAADNSVIAVTDNPIKQYVQTADTDGDGIRDWEEELRGTDPLVPNERATTTENEFTFNQSDEAFEPPETLTDQFALNFFEDFVRARGSEPLSATAQQALVTDAADSIANSVRDPLYTRADISISSENTLDTIRRYGNAVGKIIQSHTVTENEMVVLQRAMTTEDPEELKALAPIRQAYRGMIEEMLAVSAPSSVVEEHLDLINTFVLIENDIKAFEQVFDDPLLTLAYINRYPDDATGLYYAVDNMRTAFEQAGIVYTADESGIFFFSLRP